MAWYMAELLVLVVIAGLVLLYAADRARKLRARARRMGAMNDRLDVAAAKVDEQQERKQARVKAMAELTSVLPAIKRPPLTLPGVPGPATEPEEEEPAAAKPAAKAASPGTQPAAGGPPAAGGDTPAQAGDAHQVTSDGTLILPPVPGQGPAPAGGAASPRARPRAS
jgi:type II secretory pathway pseudopilin PulG